MLQILECDMAPFLLILPKQLVSNRGRPDDEQASVHDIQRRLKEQIMTVVSIAKRNTRVSGLKLQAYGLYPSGQPILSHPGA